MKNALNCELPPYIRDDIFWSGGVAIRVFDTIDAAVAGVDEAIDAAVREEIRRPVTSYREQINQHEPRS